RQGNWDESLAYFGQALALDPRNPPLLTTAAETFSMLRQFPVALKLYDRVLDITPSDPDVIEAKAAIYQAQGNLQEAAHFLSRINEQTPIDVKITQLTLERNYGEAIRLLQARLAQGHFSSEVDKGQYQTVLPLLQHLAGDNAGARLTAKQARDALDELSKNRTDDEIWAHLALANAVIGEKDQALKQAERSVMLYPSSKDPLNGPAREENLALIQTIVGENDRAISILTHLLQTSYSSLLYRTPVTPALLRLDPIWDPLRGDPAFQKLCEEKQP